MTLRLLRAALVGVALATLSADSAAARTRLRVASAFARSASAGRSARQAPAAATAPAGNAANGKILYAKIGCYQCHSEQGQGGTQGPRLGPRPISFPAFLRYVRTPTGEMPPYKAKVMSDRDVADVYAFLQALPAPPPLSTLPLLQP